MDEGILIEIAGRRRKLEEQIESAQHWLMTIDTNSETMGEVNGTHAGLEICAEACRDDMNTLMEFIRKARA